MQDTHILRTKKIWRVWWEALCWWRPGALPLAPPIKSGAVVHVESVCVSQRRLVTGVCDDVISGQWRGRYTGSRRQVRQRRTGRMCRRDRHDSHRHGQGPAAGNNHVTHSLTHSSHIFVVYTHNVSNTRLHRIFGPIPWGHSGPLCHALSLLLLLLSWTSLAACAIAIAGVRLATPGDWQCNGDSQ